MNKIKHIIKNFLIWKIAFPIIRKYTKDSSLIEYYRREGGKLIEVEDLLSVISLQGHSNNSIHCILSGFDKVVRFKPLTPLTFDDSEWQDAGLDGVKQNTRIGSVFKEPNGHIHDNAAITWIENSGFRYDVAKQCCIASEYATKGYGFSGGCIVVNINGDLFLTSSSQHLKMSGRKNFTGSNHISVPVIEIFDSSDKKNDFICYYTSIEYFDDKFWNDYILTEMKYSDEKTMFNICKKHINELNDKLKLSAKARNPFKSNIEESKLNKVETVNKQHQPIVEDPWDEL